MKREIKAEVPTLPVVIKQAPNRPKYRPKRRVRIAAAKGKKTTKRYILKIKKSQFTLRLNDFIF